MGRAPELMLVDAFTRAVRHEPEKGEVHTYTSAEPMTCESLPAGGFGLPIQVCGGPKILSGARSSPGRTKRAHPLYRSFKNTLRFWGCAGCVELTTPKRYAARQTGCLTAKTGCLTAKTGCLTAINWVSYGDQLGVLRRSTGCLTAINWVSYGGESDGRS
jgi:hypothetical protein